MTGRRSGATIALPVVILRVRGAHYLVSMLGECHWTKNIRANDGWVILHWGRPYRRHVTEVPARERAPILSRYVEKVPGGRPHIPVPPGAPIEEFEEIEGLAILERVIVDVRGA